MRPRQPGFFTYHIANEAYSNEFVEKHEVTFELEGQQELKLDLGLLSDPNVIEEMDKAPDLAEQSIPETPETEVLPSPELPTEVLPSELELSIGKPCILYLTRDKTHYAFDLPLEKEKELSTMRGKFNHLNWTGASDYLFDIDYASVRLIIPISKMNDLYKVKKVTIRELFSERKLTDLELRLPAKIQFQPYETGIPDAKFYLAERGFYYVLDDCDSLCIERYRTAFNRLALKRCGLQEESFFHVKGHQLFLNARLFEQFRARFDDVVCEKAPPRVEFVSQAYLTFSAQNKKLINNYLSQLDKPSSERLSTTRLHQPMPTYDLPEVISSQIVLKPKPDPLSPSLRRKIHSFIAGYQEQQIDNLAAKNNANDQDEQGHEAKRQRR